MNVIYYDLDLKLLKIGKINSLERERDIRACAGSNTLRIHPEFAVQKQPICIYMMDHDHIHHSSSNYEGVEHESQYQEQSHLV